MTSIANVDAWEVFDSRGNPTVRVRIDTDTATGTFTVPAGASTGAHEAIERRDGEDRYRGKGVQNAVTAVNKDLAPLVTGRSVHSQQSIDEAMIDYDGTENLSNVGANAILGVSGAVAHAASNTDNVPLYEYLAPDEPGRLPLPMVNILSGGLHAQGGIEIQDFLIIPTSADSYTEALKMIWNIRQNVRDQIIAEGHRPLVADEGGFSPPLDSIDDAFKLLEAGVRAANHDPVRSDVAFAVDVAATHFYDRGSGVYELQTVGKTLLPTEMVELIEYWTKKYPLISVEDPLAEDDWDHWMQLHDTLGDEIQLLGDDLLVTNIARLDRAQDIGAANAVLVKPNQAGTMTRTINVIEESRDKGFAPVVSARSGETSDTTIADLATAFGTGQIKIGSLARSERLAKYNRLVRIDQNHSAGLAQFPQI